MITQEKLQLQTKAYGIVKRALIKGLLIRPNSCTRCSFTKQTKDNRSYIQAHHHDYTKPLDIEWICAKCHRKETPHPIVVDWLHKSGSENSIAKFTDNDVYEIRKSKKTNRQLAKIYNVHYTTIGRAKKSTTYKVINAAPKG